VVVDCEITLEGIMKVRRKKKENGNFDMERGSLDILKKRFGYLPGNDG